MSCSGPYLYMYACANAKLEALASDRASGSLATNYVARSSGG